MSGSRLQNLICQLPNPQFPDRDFTAKNIRGFISNTKTPNSSDTQRHQKELTESLHREHITRLRPSNTTETITIHTVTKTLQTDQSLPDRNKRELHRYFTSWRLTPKPLGHLPT